MKILILFTLIPGILCAAARPQDPHARRIVSLASTRSAAQPGVTPPIDLTSKPRTRTSGLETKKDSPVRNNIHSKSAEEIPSLTNVEEASHALEDHAQDPYSSSFSPVGSPSKWTSSSVIRSSSQTRKLNMGSKSQPEKVKKAAELNKDDEETWRKMRFGHRKLQRSVSEPSNLNFEHQVLSTSMNIAHTTRLAARAVYMQDQTQRHLTAESKELESLRKNMAADSKILKGLLLKMEGLLYQQATLLSTVEGLTSDVHLLAQRVAMLEGMSGPVSPRSSIDGQRTSIDASRSSIEKDRRSRSNGSFLGLHFGGTKDS